MELDEMLEAYHTETKTRFGGIDKDVADVKAVAASADTKAGKALTALDRIEVALSRFAIGGAPGARPAQEGPEVKAFDRYVRRGKDELSLDEVKVLQAGEDPMGGYLAPAEFIADLQRNLVVFSPVRFAARVGSTSKGAVRLPKRTAEMTAGWVAEIGERPSTGPTYGMVEIPVHQAACYIDVSTSLLEDSEFDLASELSYDIAEEFGRLEGAAFVVGDGVGKPFGIMQDDGIGVSVSGSAATIADANGQADGLIDMMYALKPYYRGRSTWMMNGSTLASVRKLRDADKNYIWQPSLQAGQPETILGRPVIEAPDMPDQGAGATPILLGDFQSGYRIYDRVGIEIIRDQYTMASRGQVRFHARRRVGAATVKREAFRKLKCATS